MAKEQQPIPHSNGGYAADKNLIEHRLSAVEKAIRELKWWAVIAALAVMGVDVGKDGLLRQIGSPAAIAAQASGEQSGE